MLIKSLIRKIVLPTIIVGPVEGNFEDSVDTKPYLGYDFERVVEVSRKKVFSKQDEVSLRERRIKFITVLVHEIRQRLPSNIITLAKHISCQ